MLETTATTHEPRRAARGGLPHPATVLWLAALAVLLVLDLQTISAIPVHHDIAWPLYVARRVLGGARLYTDIVEVHPPMVIGFAMLAEMGARATGLGDIAAYHLLSLVLVAASVLLSARALRVLLPGRPWQRAVLLAAQSFLLLPYVRYSLGQEEHVMLTLVWPYMLACAAAASGRPVGRRLAITIGVLAGLGVSMKPLYAPLWLALELWLALRRGGLRRPWLRRVLRPESVAAAITIAGYVAFILAVTPEYLRVASWSAGVYPYYFPSPFASYALSVEVLLVAVPIAANALVRSEDGVGELRRIAAFLAVGCTVVVFVQHKGWTYHWYPALALALLLIGLLALDLAERLPLGRLARALPCAVAAAVTIVGLTAGGGVVLRATRTRWGQLDFGPYFLPTMEDVVRQYGGGGPIVSLSTVMQSAFPLVLYANVPYASRYSCLWMIPGLYARERGPHAGPFPYHPRERMDPVERTVYDAVIDDVVTQRPSIIIVDLLPPVPSLPDFKYLAYFSRDPRFKAEFSHYGYVGVVDRYAIFRRLN